MPPTWGLPTSRALVLIAIASTGVAAIVVCTGGFAFDLAGLRVSIRSAGAAAATALAAAALAWLLSPVVSGRRAVSAWVTDTSSVAPPVAALVALATVLTGMAAGLETAGSADATGYVASSRLLASGRLWRDEPLAARLAVPDAPHLLSPFGFIPSVDTDDPARQTPTYPPGLPLLMAAASWLAGDAGALAVVPLLGGAAVWLVFALGRAFGSPAAGLAASVLLATQPAFLFQLLQPMSDVPVTAAWLASALMAHTRRPALAGAAAGLAILIRPNLAPMAAPMLWLAIRSSPVSRAGSSAAALRRWVLASGPPVATLVALNTLWYGAPWRLGYGDATALFSASYVGPNLVAYASRLLEACGAWCLPMAIALLWPPLFRSPWRPGAMLAVATILNVAVYLPYQVFAEWHYLRFLLPGVALMLPLASEVVRRGLSAVDVRLAVPLTLLAVLLQAGWQLEKATELDVFRLPALERRYGLTAGWLAQHTEPDAVVVCAQQSGSVALNVPRSIARWDLAPAGSLDVLVDALHKSNRPVWLLVESWEGADFAARHGRTAAGALDWPPAAVIRSAVRVHVHRVSDRARYLAGGEIQTQYVNDPAGRRARR